MTRSFLIVVLLLAASAPASADASEPAFARDRIPLRVRPAEHARARASVTAGAELEVLAKRGRWLRVRHGRRVGWVTRTEVQAPPQEPIARPERRVAPAVKTTITTDQVRGFDDPRTRANEVLDLKGGDVVTVIGVGKRGWLLVESPSGDAGWIPGSAVDDPLGVTPRRARAESVATTTPTAAAETTTPTATRAVAVPARHVVNPPARITGMLVATAGAETYQLRETHAMSRATGPIGVVAAGVRLRLARELWVGVAGNAGLGGGDLTYHTATEISKPMATRNITIDANAEIGWGRAWSISARGGYHRTSFAVDSDRAEPMLVGEQVRGATVGLGGALPVGRIALSATLDVMPAGDRQLDDPTVAAATAVRGGWARGMVTVQLPAHLIAALAYRAGVINSDLDDGTTRRDRSHAVSAGLGLAW